MEEQDYIFHNKVFPERQDADAVASAVMSGQWACGRETAALEADLRSYTGWKNCVCVASGSAALRLALLALDIHSGDEVIIPAYSCVCLANAVLSLGAKPVPVDVLRRNWCIDPARAKEALTKASRAIIAINLFGASADISRLAALGLPVIDDFSHGFGAGSGVDNAAAIGLASLYATKFLGTGGGHFLQ